MTNYPNIPQLSSPAILVLALALIAAVVILVIVYPPAAVVVAPSLVSLLIQILRGRDQQARKRNKQQKE